jgi:thioredoxin 1
MEVKVVTDSNFKEEVIESSIPVLVDFWAPWCAPCLKVAPLLEKLAKEYRGQVKVMKLNVDENPIKTSEYQVMSIPNLKFFKNGVVMDEVIGAVGERELKKKLDSLLSDPL